jgi:hypothetical protein
MAKSRKTRSIKNKTSKTSKFLKSIGKNTKKAVPIIKSGLKTIGAKAGPIVEKGAENVYGALKTGFDLGVNSIKSLAKTSKKSKKRRSH